MHGSIALSLLPGHLAVCRLAGNDGLPHWGIGSRDLLVYARAPEETTIVCEEALVPEGVRAERGFRALKVAGPIPFEAVGWLASLAGPLAEAGISIFACSTFDTDYVLVREARLARAVEVLRAAGHEVAGAPNGRAGAAE